MEPSAASDALMGAIPRLSKTAPQAGQSLLALPGLALRQVTSPSTSASVVSSQELLATAIASSARVPFPSGIPTPPIPRWIADGLDMPQPASGLGASLRTASEQIASSLRRHLVTHALWQQNGMEDGWKPRGTEAIRAWRAYLGALRQDTTQTLSDASTFTRGIIDSAASKAANATAASITGIQETSTQAASIVTSKSKSAAHLFLEVAQRDRKSVV